MKNILILKVGNGFVAMPANDYPVAFVEDLAVFKGIDDSRSYERDGLAAFLKDYFKDAPKPETGGAA